jgi:hypothetical protein
MAINPFSLSGGDLLTKKSGMVPGSAKDVLVTAKHSLGGGGGARRKPAEAEASEPAPAPEPIQVAAKQEPQVRLFNLKWAGEPGCLDGKIKISVQAELPESHKNITRVQFSLFALGPKGEKEPVESKDVFLDQGLAEAEFTLFHSPGKTDATEESRTFVCIAKHRDSKPLESPKLTAKVSQGDELTLELEDAAQIRKLGYAFALKSADGSFESVLTAKDGAEKDGKLSLKFMKLKTDGKYSLDVRDAQGKALETVFKDKAFGSWAA